MNARSKELSSNMAQEESNDEQYLTFRLDSEMFAVGILNVKELIEFGPMTPVPMMPRFVRGVINLRGNVVPVIDMSVRFGRDPTNVTKRTCIVIVEVDVGEGKQEIGVMVDAVSEVLGIPAENIEKPPAFGANIRSDFISGMGKIGDDFVIILSVNKVLSVEELSELAVS